jgi:hypothetical protein
LEYISIYEPEFLDIIGRLQTFRRFDTLAFYDIIVSIEKASQFKHFEAIQANAATSFKIRANYQKIIESTRVFRAILEIKVPGALEDFDDVAVDINAKVEQACNDAIQDSYTQ